MSSSPRGARPASRRSTLLGERFARNGLADRAAASPAAAAALTVALQAQDEPAARLGVRARAADVGEASVRAAIECERSVVRTWLMRGTIHLVDTADLRWLVRLIGPAVARKFGTRWHQLGLTAQVLRRAEGPLQKVLAEGPRTRREIRDGLAEHGITLGSSDPQAYAHLVLHASTTGLLCRGPGNCFALLDDWLPTAPAGPSGDEALALLARRYFAAFSPATAADFTTWSGLPSARALDLIRDELQPADVDGRAGFRLGEVEPLHGVRLVPAFDNYVLGYRDRAALLDPSMRPRIYQGGIIRPSVVRDGRIIGSWALERATGRVRVESFDGFAATVERAIAAEVADLQRFVDQPLHAEIS